MTENKRKKNSRQRGSWTHGWGAKKKHRGAGHRGGRGRAGSGKKGDAKKTLYWGEKNFGKGKIGFTSLANTKFKTINLSHLDSILDRLVVEGKVTKKADSFEVNLTKLGYQKLLGTGNITRKLNVTVYEASEKAKEKLEKAGGKIVLTKKEKVVSQTKEKSSKAKKPKVEEENPVEEKN